MTVSKFQHNGRTWRVVLILRDYYARDDQGQDTGPYRDAAQAEEWIRAIRP